MPIYKERRKDCKYYVEKSLQSLGFKVNSTIQEKYAERECSVIYIKFDTNPETQFTYWSHVSIKVLFDVVDNNDIPNMVTEILKKVTKDVEISAAAECTSFYFNRVDVFPNAQSSRIEMNAIYSMESDWINS